MGKVTYYWEERKAAATRAIESDLAEAECRVDSAKECLESYRRMHDAAKADLQKRKAVVDSYRLMLMALDRVNPDEMV